jgi:hypothetical protein
MAMALWSGKAAKHLQYAIIIIIITKQNSEWASLFAHDNQSKQTTACIA